MILFIVGLESRLQNHGVVDVITVKDRIRPRVLAVTSQTVTARINTSKRKYLLKYYAF